MVDLFNLEPDDPLNYGMLAAASQLLTPASRGGGLGPAFGSFGATVSNERRARENQELVKLKIATYRKDLKERAGAGDPAAWREWQLFDALPEDKKLQYLDLKRNNNQITKIGEVPTVVNRQSQVQSPLSTLGDESLAKQIIARSAAQGKGYGQLDTAPPEPVSVNGQLQYQLPRDTFLQAGGRLPNMGASQPGMGIPPQLQRELPPGLTEKQKIQGMTAPELAQYVRSQAGPMPLPMPQPPKVAETGLDITKAAAIDRNKSAQTVADEQAEKVRQYSELEKIFDKAELLLPHATGSGVGEYIDKAGRFFGHDFPGHTAASSLETLQAHAMRYVPRFKGQDSNRDVQLYEKAVATLGDRGKTKGERQKALKDLRELIAKAKSQGADVGDADTPSAKPDNDPLGLRKR